VVWKIKHAVDKIQIQEKQICGRIKYEISTNLPSARARRFKSDVQDFSPAVLTICRLALENWMTPNSRPFATPCLIFFYVMMQSVGVLARGVVHPRVLALRCPDESGSVAPPCI